MYCIPLPGGGTARFSSLTQLTLTHSVGLLQEGSLLLLILGEPPPPTPNHVSVYPSESFCFLHDIMWSPLSGYARSFAHCCSSKVRSSAQDEWLDGWMDGSVGEFVSEWGLLGGRKFTKAYCSLWIRYGLLSLCVWVYMYLCMYVVWVEFETEQLSGKKFKASPIPLHFLLFASWWSSRGRVRAWGEQERWSKPEFTVYGSNEWMAIKLHFLHQFNQKHFNVLLLKLKHPTLYYALYYTMLAQWGSGLVWSGQQQPIHSQKANGAALGTITCKSGNGMNEWVQGLWWFAIFHRLIWMAQWWNMVHGIVSLAHYFRYAMEAPGNVLESWLSVKHFIENFSCMFVIPPQPVSSSVRIT